MAKILTKNSFTPGSAPSGLSAGELAVNVPDRKIYVGNVVGGVVTLHDQQNLVTSVNGSTGAVFAVSNVNGETGGITLAAGTGIGVAKIGSKNITISNNGVISVNGSSGVIGSIAVTNASQSFVGLQLMPSGISTNGIIDTGNLTVSGNVTFSGTSTALNSTSTTVANANANLTIESLAGAPFGLPGNIILTSSDGVENAYSAKIAAPDTLTANCTNKLPTTSGTLLNTATPYVTSINGATGAITGLTASQLLITNSNSASTVYPLFTFGAGTTAVYADITTTPLSYVPSTGTVNARIFNGTFGASNVAKIDSQLLTVTITDGTDAVAFTNGEFSKTGTSPYVFTTNTGFTFSSTNGIQFTNDYNSPTWSYRFPQSNGSNGQVLTTNGAGTLSWTTVSGGGGGGGIAFTYASSAPGTPTVGDRWIDSDTGKEYVYVNDGSSSQWIEPVSSNGLSGVTYTPSTNFLEFGVTGSFVKLGVNNTSPQYTLDVNGIINAPVGISAGPITSSGATFSGAVVSAGPITSSGATFSGAVVSDGGYRITSSAINAQTGTTYTLLTSDNGKIITMSNGSAITLTVPAGLPVGYNTTVIQLGVGQVGITASSTTLNSFEGKLKLAGQHAAASIISYTTNVFNVAGGLTA